MHCRLDVHFLPVAVIKLHAHVANAIDVAVSVFSMQSMPVRDHRYDSVYTSASVQTQSKLIQSWQASKESYVCECSMLINK